MQVDTNQQKKGLLRRGSLQLVGAVVSPKRDSSVNCTLECKPHSRGGVFPYMGNICIFGPKEYNSFLVVLVRNRILTLAILVSNKVQFLHSTIKLDMFLNLSYLKKKHIIIAFNICLN